MKKTKGIILAGGTGSRLFPVTKVISKQLIPVYDKPMVFYPIDILRKCKISETLIISDKYNIKLIKKLLGNGKQFKMNFAYKVQNKPNGIPEAFSLGKKFIKNDNTILILGDNILLNTGKNFANSALKNLKKGVSTIFGYRVKNPERYGVVSINNKNQIKTIIEKPKKPLSNIAVIGLYFFTNDVIQKVKNLTPSKRGELEIVDLMKKYLVVKKLKLKILEKKNKWFDTGTFNSILAASKFIASKKK